MNEHKLANIEKMESKIKSLLAFKKELNKTFKNDAPDNSDNKSLFEQGSNLKYLIYNNDKQVFEFVEPSVGKNKNISIPYTNLTGGINSCNLYINKEINHCISFLENLKRNK